MTETTENSVSLENSEIANLLDLNSLASHITNKIVKREVHPTLPLAILNYTHKATFENIWDSVTMLCRGLIYNYETGQVVARGFKKFFNYNCKDRQETLPENIPIEEPEITEKLDGSLGILWRYKGRWGVATRGSFDSEQAKWAEDWINLNVDVERFPKDSTPLFEIIYPENQIVVKYPYKGCVLIGCVDNAGKELKHEELVKIAEAAKIKVVDKIEDRLRDISDIDLENEEGYVATWHQDPPLKVKIKFTTYFKLHRLMTSTNTKRIWEMLRFKLDLAELVTNVPTEFKDWVVDWISKLTKEYAKIEATAKSRFGHVKKFKNDRKQFAAAALDEKNCKVSSILFKMLDERPYDDLIWNMIKPITDGVSPFKKVE